MFLCLRMCSEFTEENTARRAIKYKAGRYNLALITKTLEQV